MRRLILALAIFLATSNLHAQKLVDHVFIISLDGGKPAVIASTEMPVLKSMVSEGAVTWTAQTIFPSKTLPSHTSMFTGLSPAKHHVLWNNYQPEKGVILAPTVFTIARQFDPKISTALFAGKVKFRHLWQSGSLDRFDYKGPQSETPLTAAAASIEEVEKSASPASEVASAAAAYIVKEKPVLCGIHFPDPDTAGHRFGWGSPEQVEAFKATDKALGVVLGAIKQAGVDKRCVVIISADHGGHNKTHGDNIPDDMNIPWIASGAGVKPHFEITDPVTTYDTTATVLWLLGIPIPAELDGKPVKQAFQFSPKNP